MKTFLFKKRIKVEIFENGKEWFAYSKEIDRKCNCAKYESGIDYVDYVSFEPRLKDVPLEVEVDDGKNRRKLSYFYIRGNSASGIYVELPLSRMSRRLRINILCSANVHLFNQKICFEVQNGLDENNYGSKSEYAAA